MAGTDGGGNVTCVVIRSYAQAHLPKSKVKRAQPGKILPQTLVYEYAQVTGKRIQSEWGGKAKSNAETELAAYITGGKAGRDGKIRIKSRRQTM